MSSPAALESMQDLARLRFQADPSKCYQRHIRELYAETEPSPAQIESLAGAQVVAVSKEEAAAIILKYEWLRTMDGGPTAFYGLKQNGELLGACCFGKVGSRQARNICGPDSIDKTICLTRGACVPHAPKNAASFFIRWACRRAYKDHGWCVFFAYSDESAGEIGTVYQAAGWFYIGRGLGRPPGNVHLNWRAPDGRVISSQTIHHGARSKRDLVAAGYVPEPALPKHKWVWFEGSPRERRLLRSQCRYEFLPYPKRPRPPDHEPG